MSHAKIITALMFAIAAAGSVPYAAAFLYNISHTCEDNCLSGTGVAWNVTLHKGAGLPVEVSKVEIIESGSKKQLGIYNSSTVMVYSKSTFVIKGTLPGYAEQDSINVTPCFTTLLGTGSGSRVIDDVFVGLDRTYCEKANYSTPIFQCITPVQCTETETCANNTCLELNCGPCQYIANHNCTSYGCCGDAGCSPAETCRNNTCLSLSCVQGYKAVNHSCAEIICQTDEFVKNNECEPLACSEDEAARNHTCAKLACGKGEAARNHTCAKIPPEPASQQPKKNATAGNSTSAGNSATLQQQPGAAYEFMEILLLGTILGMVVLFANTFYLNHKH